MNLKFTTYNFKNIFPNSPITFKMLIQRPYAKVRKMPRDNSFNMVNYLYINDIISILERGIKSNSSPNKTYIKRWQYFLNNDIQEYLDLEHEQLTNSN